jgi:hypothetical protein
MRKCYVLAAGAVVATALIGSTDSQAKSKCVMAGGEATMVTQDLAKYMANAALKNAIAAHKWTAKGAVKVKCDTGTMGLAHCSARQKACG